MFVVELLVVAFLFVSWNWVISFYFAAGATAYACYLVIDTYIVQKWTDVDDYILASITIYIDVARMLLYLLIAFGKRK